ncbi:MAG: hypothetical protein IIZ36_02955 [Ruminococcus sp.]|nr:hypothetical protein [Ruminococcus sp.]
MAYNKNNAAYDLSLFDEEASLGSAAPKRGAEEAPENNPAKTRRKKAKIVQLPEKELQKIRLRKHNPLKIVFSTLCALVISAIIGAIIVGQVQLTELNQKVITAQEMLEDKQSIYIQNQMKVEANLSNAEIERYAQEELGMTKASNAQKEFISLESGDKAEVSAHSEENIFTKFIESIKNLWS